MSISSLFYTSVACRIASVFSLAVFFYSYWTGLENRLLILCLGIALTAWLVGTGFYYYFEQVVTKLAVAKHIARQNMIDRIVEEENQETKAEVKHPLFTKEDE